jgi:hypothetical protein
VFRIERIMSAAQQPPNKVLLRLKDSGVASSDFHQQASNYEVYLVKYDPRKGKHFYCNLNTRSSSWDSPVGTEEVRVAGKSADDIWTDLNVAFEEVRVAEASLQKAQQRKVALLEGLRPRKSNPDSEARGGGEHAPTTQASTPRKTDSSKGSSRANGVKPSDSAVAVATSVSADADASKPRVSEAASADPVVAKVFVNWAASKPDPEITAAQLQEAFKQFGAIEVAFILSDPLLKGKKKPCGFVQFKNAESAARAVSVKNVSIGAVKAKVDLARGS